MVRALAVKEEREEDGGGKGTGCEERKERGRWLERA